MTALINRFLGRFGYRYYKIQFQPFGIDHALDIRRFIEPHREVRVIFDVGANEGQSAQLYAERFSNAAIYSFEPVTATFRKLKENTSRLDRVKAFQIAFGNKPCELEIKLFEQSVRNTLKGLSDSTSSFNTELVSVSTLDSFAKQYCIEQIDFLKIDTEGFDLEVLHGAKNMLMARAIMFILVEVTFNRTDQVHTSFYDVEAYLNEFGFDLVDLYDQDYISCSPPRPPLAYCNALFYQSE